MLATTRTRATTGRRRTPDATAERGATDPILVIAAIAVSLVLLVGGSYAVAGIITSGNDLNAQGDLEKVSTTQESLFASTDGLYVYDNHRESEHRLLQRPPVDSGVIGFTPTAGGRLIVDVAGPEWIATSVSKSGTVYMRSSEQRSAIEVGTTTLPMASTGFAMTVADVPGAAYPAGFSSADITAMMDAIDDDRPYFTADQVGLPGYGIPSGPGVNPGNPGGNPDGGNETPDAGGADIAPNGALGRDAAGNPFGLQATSAWFDPSEGFISVDHSLSFEEYGLLDTAARPYADAAPYFASHNARQRVEEHAVSDVRAFVDGRRVAISGGEWYFSPSRSPWGTFSVYGIGVTADAAEMDALFTRGSIQFRVDGGDHNTVHMVGVNDENTTLARRGSRSPTLAPARRSWPTTSRSTRGAACGSTDRCSARCRSPTPRPASSPTAAASPTCRSASPTGRRSPTSLTTCRPTPRCRPSTATTTGTPTASPSGSAATSPA